MATETEVTIRRAESPADYQACQQAQRAAWGIVDDSYVVPVATMVGAQHHGGLVLGAFLPDGRAVGMSFAFLGRTEGRLCLYSQLTGVVPGYQDHGLGSRMKHLQREIARAEGVPCIAWAFDPLQAGNARFNLEKLGATAGHYIVDMYGPRSDALNRNAPTDRLIAVWETSETPRPTQSGHRGAPVRLITTSPDATGRFTPRFQTWTGTPATLALPIPAEISRLRAESPDLAERWSLAVREAFLAAFRARYRAVGFVREASADGSAGHYLLAAGG